jgi:hypothetical protein
MAPDRSAELVRATGICARCDSRFTDQIVARYPAPSLPTRVAYVELRHLDAAELGRVRGRFTARDLHTGDDIP